MGLVAGVLCGSSFVFIAQGSFRLLEIEVLWEGMRACSHQHGTGAELGCASGYLGIKVFMRSEKYFYQLP